MNKKDGFRRSFKKVSAAAAAAILVAGMTTPVMAAAPVLPAPTNELHTTVKKTVVSDGNTYAPNTTFSFDVKPGTGSGTTSIAGHNQVTYNGVAGAVTFGTAAYTPADGIIDGTSGLSKDVSITVDANKFSAPGIYVYDVKETNSRYEGINYDEAAKKLYVYIGNKGDGTLEATSVFLADANGKKSDKFVNNYGDENPENPNEPHNPGDHPNDSTHDVTIAKKVTGSQGDHNKAFQFEIKVDASNSGEHYKMVVKKKDNTEQTLELVDGTPQTISLKDGETARIYGLTATDKYTAKELDAGKDGYTTTNGALSKNVTDDDTKETVTNDRNITAPTGLVTSYGPYVLMIVAAAAFGLIFFRKREAR
jgi:pilin isopeptide linkage protein